MTDTMTYLARQAPQLYQLLPGNLQTESLQQRLQRHANGWAVLVRSPRGTLLGPFTELEFNILYRPITPSANDDGWTPCTKRQRPP